MPDIVPHSARYNIPGASISCPQQGIGATVAARKNATRNGSDQIFLSSAADAAMAARRRSRLTQDQGAMPSSRAAVPPRMAIRSSSLRPGVLSTRSTSVLVHGNG